MRFHPASFLYACVCVGLLCLEQLNEGQLCLVMPQELARKYRDPTLDIKAQFDDDRKHLIIRVFAGDVTVPTNGELAVALFPTE